MPESKKRNYPVFCRSFLCGRSECDGCPDKPELDEFKQWVEDHDAKVLDQIWFPTIYVASK